MDHPTIAILMALLAFNAHGAWGQGGTSAGFISIDCGATEPYVDPHTGISWATDANFTSVGENVPSVPGSSQFANNSEAATLRYFKEPRSKYCYVMPVSPNTTYLIRATFWYGNYDRLNRNPKFKQAIDSTDMLSVDLGTKTVLRKYEFMHRTSVTATTMSYCLYRDPVDKGDPFISSLELRMMPDNAYNQPHLLTDGNFFTSLLRFNYGGSQVIRYPDDTLDRVWQPWNEPGLATISTATPVTNPTGYFLKPPSAVMQTAHTASTLGAVKVPLIQADPGVSLPGFLLILYFAELKATATATSRIFTVDVTDYLPYTLSIYNRTGGAFLPVIRQYNNFTVSATAGITLTPVAGSIDPPLINAAELYASYPERVPATMQTDVAALEEIKVALKLTGWGGDPCLPVALDWITCSASSPPRVLSVKLSNYNLTGVIPIAFGKLTSLTTLWLDNNNLTGTIPNLQTLANLQSLHLQDNFLSGTIPESLALLPLLKELYLQNNDLTGEVPASLKSKSGLTLDIRGNPACNCGGRVTPNPSSDSSKSNVGLIAGAVGGAVGAILLLGCCVAGFCVYKKRKTAQGDPNKANVEMPRTNFNKFDADHASMRDSTGTNQGARPFTLAEITAATQNFSKKIGAGGFGPVYYGKLASGREVAVKVSDVNSRQGAQEFNNEVQLLSRVHHKNLVSLLGYCQDDKSQMLVYEFLHKGTVREHLYGSPLAIEEPLDWKMRLDVAVNAAQGLEYLHTGCSPCIIHRDVKSSNILLTDKLIAKVADFGLSRLGPEEGKATHVSTQVKGTAGYLDPEYWSTNNLTEKSDVFSFGVVLLEILCARQPIDNTLRDRTQWNICDRVRNALQAGDIVSTLDPALVRCHPNMDSVWKVAELAIQSVEPRGVHRPYMRDVVKELREAIMLEAGDSGAYSDMDPSSNSNPRHAPQHVNYFGNQNQPGSIDEYSSGAGANSHSVNFDSYGVGPQVR